MVVYLTNYKQFGFSMSPPITLRALIQEDCLRDVGGEKNLFLIYML